jgi:hypothetical protein
MDATGRENIVLSFNARDIDGSGDNAIQPLAVQYRLGDTGPWITLPAGSVADASSGPGLATLNTPVTVALPADANNQPQLQIRIITTNAAGSDEWIGIDDIAVASSPLVSVNPGTLSIGDASLIEGQDGAAEMLFTVSRTGGSDGAVSANWAVAFDGTATSTDLGATLSGTVTFAAGQTSATIRVPVAGDRVFEPDETFSVLLSTPRAARPSVTQSAVAPSATTTSRRSPTSSSMKSTMIRPAPTAASLSRSRALPASTSPTGRSCSTTATAARPMRR